MGNKIFEEMRGEDEGDGEKGIVNFGGDEGARGGVSDRKHEDSI